MCFLQKSFAQESKTFPVNYGFQEKDETGINFSFRKQFNYLTPNNEAGIAGLEGNELYYWYIV